MAKQGNIKFNVGFNVDQTNLNVLKTSLQSLQNITKFDLIDVNATNTDLESIKKMAAQVGAALDKSFNSDLGVYNISKFRQGIADISPSLSALGKKFAEAGTVGQNTFRNLTNTLTSTNLELKESYNLLSKMGDTLANTVRWSIASSALNTFTGSIQKAWSFTKELDTSLNNIRIVTGKSADEMDAFAIKANRAAKELSASTKAYADAALIYYQQGLGDTEAQARASTTIKVANVTGQNASAVSEQLTAVWNGYKVNAQESELYIDKLSAVAARTAADLEELSVGMSRVASAANIMGVDIDQLNAQLATIVSVTREAPESIGTALKTVYARMSDIEAGLDTETTLGEYTAQMAEMGIRALDVNGHLRDMGDVVEEIGNKWATMTREQQVSLAQTIAGTRQYSRMMSLFDNWGMYQDALETSQKSAGTLQQQQDIYAQSLEAHLEKLGAAGEELYDKLFNSESFNDILDILTKIVEVGADFTEAIGGGGNLLLALIPTLTNLFSGTLAKGTATFVTNIKNARSNAEALKNSLEAMRDIKGVEGLDETGKQLLAIKEHLLTIRDAGLITNEEFIELEKNIQDAYAATSKGADIQASREKFDKSIKKATTYSEDYSYAEAPSFADIAEAAKAGDLSEANNLKNDLTSYINSDLTRLPQVVGDASLALDEYIEKIKNYAQNTALLGENQDDIIAKFVSQEEKLQQLSKDLQDANDSLQFREARLLADPSEQNQRAYDQAKLNLAAANEAYKKGYAEITRTIELEHRKMISIAKRTAQDMKKTAEETTKGTEEAAKQSTKKITSDLQKSFEKIDLTATIKKITSFTSALGQAASAITILQNIGSIWENEDLTTGEQLVQTMMNLTSVVGLLSPLFMSAAASYKVWAAARAKDIAQSTAGLWVMDKHGKQMRLVSKEYRDQTIEVIKNTIQFKELNKEKQEAIINSIQHGKMLDKETSELIEQSMVENATGIDGGEINGANFLKDKGKQVLSKGKTGIKAVGKGLGTIGTKVGGLFAGGGGGAAALGGGAAIAVGAAAIVGAAAVIAGITVAVVSLVKAYNKEKDALEEAKKSRERATKALTEANQAYDQATNSINSYREALNKLADENIIKGTKKWEEALQKTNQQALELMNTYKGLSNYAKFENGAWTIDETALKEIENIEKQNLVASQNALLITQQEERKAQIAYDKEMFTREVATTDFGSVMQGIGNFIFMGFSDAIGGMMGNDEGEDWGFFTQIARGENPFKDNITTDQLDAILAQDLTAITSSEKDFKRALETANINLEDDDLYKALYENSSQLRELQIQIKENNRLTAIENAQILTNSLAATGMSQEDAALYGGMISAQTATTHDSEIEKRAAQIREKDGDNENLINEWAAAMGYDIEDIKNTGGSTFEIKKAGSDEWETVDYDTLAKEYATVLVNQEKLSEEAIEQAKTTFNTLTNGTVKTSEHTDQAIRQILSSNTDATVDNLENFSYSTIKELDAVITEYGDLLTAEQISAFEKTKENIQRYYDNIEAENGWIQGTKALLASLGDSWESLISSLDNTSLTIAGNLLSQISTTMGSSLAQSSAKFVKTLGTNGLTGVINQLNLESETLVKDFVQLSKEQGIALDYSKAETFDFVYSLANLNGEMLVSEKTFSEIAEIVNTIEKYGDRISSEDYESLYKQYGDAITEYFVRMEDGTYGLTVAANTFKDAVASANSELLKSQIEKEAGKVADASKDQEDFIKNINLGVTNRQNSAFVSSSRIASNSTLTYDVIANRDEAGDYTLETLSQLVSAYLDTTEGTDLKTALEKDWGKDRSTWDWDFILDNIGGEYFSIDFKHDSAKWGDYETGWSVTTMASAVRNKAENAAKATTPYHNADQIKANMDRAAELGLLTSEEIATLNDLLTNNDNLKVENNESAASKKFKELIGNEQRTDIDTSNLKQSIITAVSQGWGEEFYSNNKIGNTGKTAKELLGETDYNEAIRQGKAAAEINEKKIEIETSETKLKNIEAQATRTENALSRLEATAETIDGIELTENLELQNNLIKEQIELNEDLIKGYKERIATELKFDGKSESEGVLRKIAAILKPDAAIDYNTASKAAVFEALGITEEELMTETGFDTFIETLLKTEGVSTEWISILETYIGQPLAEIADAELDSMSKRQALEENIVEIEQEWLEYHEEVSESYEQYVSYIEQANAALEHQLSLYELIYGERAAQYLSAYYTQQLAGAEKIMAARKEEYEAAKQAYDSMINVDNVGYTEEQIQAITDKYLESGENYFASLGELATAYQESYINTIEKTFIEFNDTLFGITNDAMNREWDWLSSEYDYFLNNLDAEMGISSIDTSFTKAINSTSSIAVQASLNKLREEELRKLREKDKLTQADLDRANKRLEIAQAEIALQEAQANRSKMRLVRGADGTYSYQYEADIDSITEKQEELRQLNGELVEIDTDALSKGLKTAKDLYAQWQEEITEMAQNGATDEEIKAVTENYKTRISEVISGLGGMTENLRESLGAVSALLGEDFSIDDVLPIFNSTFVEELLKGGIDNWSTAIDTALAKILEAKGVKDEGLENIEKNMDTAVSTFYNSIMNEENGLVAAQKEQITSLKALTEQFDTLRKTMAAYQIGELLKGTRNNEWGHTFEGGATQTASLQSFLTANGMDEILNAEIWKGKTVSQNLAEAIASGNGIIHWETWDLIVKMLAEKYGISIPASDYSPEGFDTGGYTGEWDASGRLAVLHEKELVLNQNDTKNILAAVETARALENSLSASMFESIIRMLETSYGYRIAELNKLNEETKLEQTVHITAEFPNVNSKAEIEAAFDELIMLATQKAYED